MTCSCTCGWRFFTRIKANLECPKCGKKNECPGQEKVLSKEQTKEIISREDQKSKLYHRLWDALHRDVRTKEQYRTWLQEVNQMHSCPCSNHWKRIATDPHPEDPWWSIDMHNLVNKRLGKPHFSDEEAIQKYSLDQREREYA